jgi:hypothetical protein
LARHDVGTFPGLQLTFKFIGYLDGTVQGVGGAIRHCFSAGSQHDLPGVKRLSRSTNYDPIIVGFDNETEDRTARPALHVSSDSIDEFNQIDIRLVMFKRLCNHGFLVVAGSVNCESVELQSWMNQVLARLQSVPLRHANELALRSATGIPSESVSWSKGR